MATKSTILGQITSYIKSGAPRNVIASNVRTILQNIVNFTLNTDDDVISQVDAEAGTSTDPKIFTAERVAQAIAALGGGGGALTAYATADLSRTGTATPADDPDLSIAVEANSVYAIEIHFGFRGDASADARIDVVGPSGSTVQLFSPGEYSITNHNTTPLNYPADDSFAITTTYNRLAFTSGFIETGGTAGNCTFQWAQYTSTGGNTTRMKNSWMKLTKLN